MNNEKRSLIALQCVGLALCSIGGVLLAGPSAILIVIGAAMFVVGIQYEERLRSDRNPKGPK